MRNASLEASSTSRFLLVCLHSSGFLFEFQNALFYFILLITVLETSNSEQALECLANENVNQFINNNFIFWPAMYTFFFYPSKKAQSTHSLLLYFSSPLSSFFFFQGEILVKGPHWQGSLLSVLIPTFRFWHEWKESWFFWVL